jgi:hypothetical protein
MYIAPEKELKSGNKNILLKKNPKLALGIFSLYMFFAKHKTV